jgi:glycosyltransferase 2 family protein
MSSPARRGDRPVVRMALGLLISALCLFLAFRGVRLEEVAAVLGQARPLLLLAAVGVEFLIFWAIAARWRWLFVPRAAHRLTRTASASVDDALSPEFITSTEEDRGVIAPPVGRLFQFLNIAQLANAVLPGRIGPLVRVYLAGQGTADGMAFALTTIVGEKVVEGLSLLLVTVAILPFMPLAGQLLPKLGISAALFLAVLVLMVSLASHRGQEVVTRWLERLPVRWWWLLKPAQSALAALDVWRQGRALLALAAWTVCILALTVLLNQMILWSLGICVPPVAPVVLVVVLQIGGRLPSSPASVGVFHYLSVLVLSLFGVDKKVALGYGVILHLVTYLPASLLGLFFLIKAGYSLKRLQQVADPG